jgi:hypothetical protein
MPSRLKKRLFSSRLIVVLSIQNFHLIARAILMGSPDNWLGECRVIYTRLTFHHITPNLFAAKGSSVDTVCISTMNYYPQA